MPKQEFERSHQPEQENRLPQPELEVAATELRNLFENRFKNSEMNSVMNDSGKVIVPTHHISAPLYEPRWAVDLSKDKVEIRRITTDFWFGEIPEKRNDEKITITTGILPSVRYEFIFKDDRGLEPKQTNGLYENTRSAVTKSKEVIEAFPQAARTQKAPLR